LNIFGAPSSGVGKNNDSKRSSPAPSSEFDWHLMLSNDTVKSVEEHEEEQGSNSLDELMFTIRGYGFDKDNLSYLVEKCLLESTDESSITVSNGISTGDESDLDRQHIWQIIHNATITEHLLEFLEWTIPGLKFLSNYETKITMDMMAVTEGGDEMELLSLSRKYCVHPACIPVPVSNDSTRRGATAAVLVANSDESDDEVDSISENVEELGGGGGGSLLGVDLEYLNVCINDRNRSSSSSSELFDSKSEDEIINKKKKTDISRFIRPIEERMAIFVSTVRDIEDMAIPFHLNVESFKLADTYTNSNDEAASLDRFVGEGHHTCTSRPDIDEEYKDCSVKIVDLGNACWTYKHFTDDIQTRQYRSPEVILGSHYDTSADIWSLACILFELVTGDLLFDPQSGKTWDREEDHLALMMELLGSFPRAVYTSGTRCSDFFNRKGDLRHIHHLKYWALRDVLHEKYKLSLDDAIALSDFLLPMLEINSSKRATAADCLKHHWISITNGEGEGDSKSNSKMCF